MTNRKSTLSEEKHWLSLKGASDLLGVHPSTVRKWSNDGKLPVHFTQGGHRRYLENEVELWRQAQSVREPPESNNLMQAILNTVHMQVSTGQLEQQPWYLKLDIESRNQYRSSGRLLAEGLIQFLNRAGNEAFAQARAIGYEYGSRSRRYSLTQYEATQAYLFFRNTLMDAMLNAYETVHLLSPSAWAAMLRKFVSYTDQVLLSLMESYEVHSNHSSLTSLETNSTN